MITWTVVGQKVDNTSELRRSTTAVYRRDRQALSTTRFCRTGQIATADTCFTFYSVSGKGAERIVISVSVCLCVFLPASISPELYVQSS